MSDYTTTTEVPTTKFDFSAWEVAQSEPSLTPDVNYKTTHVQNDNFEYVTKYHSYSLEKLEKLEKKKPQIFEDAETGLLLLA